MDTRTYINTHLLAGDDRERPISFAGRSTEIARILSRLSSWAPGTAGRTLVVQGAPGAGKTALLREVAARFEASGNGRALRFEAPWEEAEQRSVLAELGSALFDVAPAELRAARSHETSVGGGVLGFIRGKGTFKRSVEPPPMEHWRDFAAHFAAKAGSAKPTLLLVDEARTFSGGGLLLRLHTQEAFPILLVCAGLAPTRGRLHELGVSRLGADALIQIGALSIDLPPYARRDQDRTFGGDTGACLDRMLHAGLIEAGEDGLLRPPIPSFSEYLHGRGADQRCASPITSALT